MEQTIIKELIKSLGLFTLGSVSITGLLTYFFNKLFEHKLLKINAENQIRFSRIYNDRTDQWRKTYKNLVIAERHLEYLLRPLKFNPTKTKEQIEDDAVKSINALFDDYDENKILFEDHSISIIENLRDKFIQCWGKQFQIEFLRDLKGSKEFSDAVKEAHKTYDEVIKIEIPLLKENLRMDIRKQLLLE